MKELETLLNRRWILKSEDKELYYKIRDAVGEIRKYSTDKLGCQIIDNSLLVKMEKIPVVTEKFIIPKLGKYYFDEEEPSQDGVPSKKERKGVILSLGATFIALLLLVYCIIKGLPFSGLLLDLSQNKYVDMLFGEGSYFYQGSVTIFSFLLIFCSLIYGMRV